MRPQIRNAHGVYLVELLVALAISGLLAVALSMCAAQVMQCSSGAQNQLLVADLANQVLERIRQSYQGVSTMENGTYQVPVYSDGLASPGVYPLPGGSLIMDLGAFNWGNSETNSAASANRNKTISVTATVSDAPSVLTNGKQITVAVEWQEGTGHRQYQLVGLISSAGIHQ